MRGVAHVGTPPALRCLARHRDARSTGVPPHHRCVDGSGRCQMHPEVAPGGLRAPRSPARGVGPGHLPGRWSICRRRALLPGAAGSPAAWVPSVGPLRRGRLRDHRVVHTRREDRLHLPKGRDRFGQPLPTVDGSVHTRAIHPERRASRHALRARRPRHVGASDRQAVPLLRRRALAGVRGDPRRRRLLMFGDPHINFYEGHVFYDDLRVEVRCDGRREEPLKGR